MTTAFQVISTFVLHVVINYCSCHRWQDLAALSFSITSSGRLYLMLKYPLEGIIGVFTPAGSQVLQKETVCFVALHPYSPLQGTILLENGSFQRSYGTGLQLVSLPATIITS